MNKIELVAKNDAKASEVLMEYGFSYNSVCKMFRNKDVRIDNIKTSSDTQVFKGQTVTCFCKELPNKKYEVFYEDENIFIINKKSGIEVEGESGLEGQLPATAVHRLDRNTEGILIMAKNQTAKEELLLAIKNRAIVKKYICEVVGAPKFNGQSYKAFLFKDSKNSQVKIYDKKETATVEIETKFKTIKAGTTTSVVTCELVTGKTHQIRAQLAHMKFPILGDMKYGEVEVNKKLKEKTQKLHCYYIKLGGLEKLSYLNEKEFVCLPEWAKNIYTGEN